MNYRSKKSYLAIYFFLIAHLYSSDNYAMESNSNNEALTKTKGSSLYTSLGDGKSECTVCQVVLSNPSGALKHIRTLHADKYKAAAQFYCAKCDQYFLGKPHSTSHKRKYGHKIIKKLDYLNNNESQNDTYKPSANSVLKITHLIHDLNSNINDNTSLKFPKISEKNLWTTRTNNNQTIYECNLCESEPCTSPGGIQKHSQRSHLELFKTVFQICETCKKPFIDEIRFALHECALPAKRQKTS